MVIGIGPEPVCTYGYYDYYPYSCAPYGYWGPEFFFEHRFRGVGPWDGRGHGYDYYRGEGRFHQGYIDHGTHNHDTFRGDRGFHEGNYGNQGPHGGHR